MDAALTYLVERLRRNEPAALGEAYDLHHEHVHAFSRRLVGDIAANTRVIISARRPAGGRPMRAATTSHARHPQRRKRELAQALVRALDTLPFEQRVAIVLCEVEDRTCAEAADIVGAPEATVRTRIFHGKRKLREALAAMGISA